MHYLECIALLNYQLKKLCAGQRAQVDKSVADETLQTLVNIQAMLGSESSSIAMRVNDIMRSIDLIHQQTGLIMLTESMKDALVGGLRELLNDICIKAFNYHKVNDFENTAQIRPLMRQVVEVALEKGLI